jgi:hypothetical protein
LRANRPMPNWQLSSAAPFAPSGVKSTVTRWKYPRR